MRQPLEENRKPHYVLVDGIVAGEGDGPGNPDPVETGIVVFGTNPATVDAACACLMGFDPDKIPVVRQAFHARKFPLASGVWQDVQILSKRREWNCTLGRISDSSTFHFKHHVGWAGKIERNMAIFD